MGGRALIAIAALAVAGAGAVAAFAGPGAPAGAAGAGAAGAGVLAGHRFRLALPDGWSELPALAPPLAATDVGGLERRGLGDPGTGCYALAQSAPAPEGDDLAPVERGLAAALGKAGLGTTTRLTGGGVDGAVTTRLVPGAPAAIVSLACFGDGREPALCRAQCDALVASLEVGR